MTARPARAERVSRTWTIPGRPIRALIAIVFLLALPAAVAGDRYVYRATGLGRAGRPVPALNRPVIGADFPDPDVVAWHGRYYAFATNSASANIQTFESTDLLTWVPGPDALPRLAPWASDYGFLRLTWAPSVAATKAGFVMYYTTGNPYGGQQCISSARAESPLGPYTDDSSAPVVCQYLYGGDIDPSIYTDGHQRYLLWKSDGNCCGKPTFIWSQPLSGDGDLSGHARILLVSDQAWQGGVIEAPAMVRDHSVYYLFFSANHYDSPGYAIGYAVCASPSGPCAQPSDRPVLRSSGTVIGPGGGEFFRGPGHQLLMCYSAGTSGAGPTGGPRAMWLTPVTFAGGVPAFPAPTARGGDRPR